MEKEYFFDQKLKRETNYKFGLKEGIEKTYSFNYYDNTETEVNYVAGQENGNKKIYIINSKGKYLSEKIMYKNSKKNGSHKKYDQNGNLTLEENYLDDKIVGKSTEYNNGKIKEIKIYNEEGSLLEINDYKLKKNSEEEYLEEKHKYFAPIPEGTHFCYYENEISTKYGEDGDVLSICQYKNKKLEGKAKSYFKFKGKSILMECNFKNDLFDGYTLEVLWKKNGEYHKLYNEKYFREDLPDENDDSIELLYQKRYFRAGKPHGLSIRYKSLDLSGEIEKVELFENGVSVKDTKENRKRIMSYFDDIQDSIQNKTEINTKQTSSKKQTKTVSKEKKKSKIGLAMILIIIIGIILLLSSTGIFGLMFLDMIAG